MSGLSGASIEPNHLLERGVTVVVVVVVVVVVESSIKHLTIEAPDNSQSKSNH
jgi:hypothetical protein